MTRPDYVSARCLSNLRLLVVRFIQASQLLWIVPVIAVDLPLPQKAFTKANTLRVLHAERHHLSNPGVAASLHFAGMAREILEACLLQQLLR